MIFNPGLVFDGSGLLVFLFGHLDDIGRRAKMCSLVFLDIVMFDVCLEELEESCFQGRCLNLPIC